MKDTYLNSQKDINFGHSEQSELPLYLKPLVNVPHTSLENISDKHYSTQ
jgi:hypothetical protein